jgi:HD-GYP domain-containing protein (c-di-GMP phosphodiesterase class II)
MPPYQDSTASVSTSQLHQRSKGEAKPWASFGFMGVLACLSLVGLWRVVLLYLDHQRLASDFYFYLVLLILPLVIIVPLAMSTTRRNERTRNYTNLQNRMDLLKSRFDNREDLMRMIADHQPGSVTIFDKDNRYWFVNKRAAQVMGKPTEEILGKPPLMVLSQDALARRLEVRLAEVRTLETSKDFVDQIKDERGEARFIQSHYEPLAPQPDLVGGILVSEEDLTPIIIERERRARMLRQIIDTLVAVVDRRDPYAAGHSAKVGQLSQLIAVEMGLAEKEIEAAEIAGSLMNFGKVLVERDILTKTSPLTPEELQRVRDSILTSADILSIIGFDSPVVPTLQQVQERYDGSGIPHGLKGDKILITSRIVTVANAFVAFVSPRAHRESMSFKDAVQRMMLDAGKSYDDRVIVALAHFIENRPNRLDWLAPTKQA